MSIETNVQIPSSGEIEIKREDQWTNIQVDSQVMSLFMACPYKYELVFVRHLQPVGGVSKSIKRGLIVHDGMLLYWRERIKSGDYKEAVQLCVRKVQELLNAESSFDHEEKLDTLQNLVQFLQHIQSYSWIPLEAEKYFKIKILEDEGLRLRIFITGRIDLIVRLPQIPIFPIDLKTESERWFHSAMSNQFRIYSLACGTNLLGVQRIGFQKTLSAEEKFKVETIAFDQDVLEEYRTVTIPHYIKQLIMCHEDNFFPMNNTSCVHGHFKCQFSDGMDHKGICTASRSIREQKLGRYFVVGPEWNPAHVGD